MLTPALLSEIRIPVLSLSDSVSNCVCVMMSLHLARREITCPACCIVIVDTTSIQSAERSVQKNRAVCIITVETYVETPTKTIQYLVGTSWVRAEGRKQSNSKKKLEAVGTVDLQP